MIRPQFLKKGDQVLLLSPAGAIAEYDVYPAVALLESWGLEVKIAPHSFSKHYRFAGTDEQRTQDFQAALDDVNIKAIFCNRGGYGSIRLIDKLKFKGFERTRKWLVGFSDITVLHSYWNTILKCESLHAPMPINLSDKTLPKETLENLRKALFGEKLLYHIPADSYNILGEIKAELVGGNLATLTNLFGTGISYITKGKILFIEDIDEPIHKIDQMLWALKFSGKLANLKGLIVGNFNNIGNDPEFGKTVKELIYEKVAEYGYPVAFNFPVGHCPHNYPMFVGRTVYFTVDEDFSTLSFA